MGKAREPGKEVPKGSKGGWSKEGNVVEKGSNAAAVAASALAIKALADAIADKAEDDIVSEDLDFSLLSAQFALDLSLPA